MNRYHLWVLSALLLLAATARSDIVVRDDTGQEVHLKKPARRIITLAPHAAESLYAAGGGNYLVGTVDYSDYPAAAQKIPRVGGYSRIDLEAVIALKPDLIIAWQSGNTPAQIDQLRHLGMSVFVTQPNLMADIATQLEKLGQLAGTQNVAQAAAESFRQEMNRLRSAHANQPKVRVFYQIWKSPLMTVGGQQIITDAIHLCGGENAFGQLESMAPTVSLEAVMAADPEVIIATGMGDARPEWLNDWNKWTRMTAVKRHNLFHINPDIMQRHTPRILEGTAKLCAALDIARHHRPPQ